MAAVEEVGLDIVHQHVGREPSGLPFNSMALKEVDPKTHPTGARAIPHNVMVNAGAIMVSALLMEKEPSLATRYKSLLSLYQRLFGGKAPNFSNATFLSEKEKCDRNWVSQPPFCHSHCSLIQFSTFEIVLLIIALLRFSFRHGQLWLTR